MNDPRAKHSFLLGEIDNGDQTTAWFDMPSRRTVSAKGERQVHLLTTGNTKNRFTVMCCTADEPKLPPFLQFKKRNETGEGKVSTQGYRAGERKGFFNDETVLERFHLVRCRRPGALLKPRSMLIMDSPRLRHQVSEEGSRLDATWSLFRAD